MWPNVVRGAGACPPTVSANVGPNKDGKKKIKIRQLFIRLLGSDLLRAIFHRTSAHRVSFMFTLVSHTCVHNNNVMLFVHGHLMGSRGCERPKKGFSLVMSVDVRWKEIQCKGCE